VKRVLIIAHYCGELDGRLSNRFVYLANLLSEQFEVELITSNFYHTKKTHKSITGNYSFKITLIEEPGYKKNVSIKRVISHKVFGKNLSRYLNQIKEVDIVYSSFPSFSVVNTAYEFAKLHGGKLVIDIQDLWPESFEKFLGKNKISGLFLNFLSNRVKNLYQKCDAIVAVSNTFLSTPKSVVLSKTPLVSVYIGASKYPEFNFDKRYPDNGGDTIKLLYLGSLGESYDIITAISAYNIAKEELKGILRIEFDIIGDGARKSYFEQYAEESNSTVRFLGLIDYSEVQKIIPNYDIALNPISSWSVASIINKHGDYALAALPVLNTQKSQEYIDLLNKYNCGLTSEAGNSKDLADNIIKLCKNKDLLLQMRENAKIMASENFDRAQTYKRIEHLLIDL
jgi:glycosyltransferase involved in cell wall biosynthesis